MENYSEVILYIIVFVIVVCFYIVILAIVLKFDKCLIGVFVYTVITSVGVTFLLSQILKQFNSSTSNFIGSKDYYDNYYTKGMYTQGQEKYDTVGGQKDFELYKQYLKEQAQEPKTYEYPNYEVYPDTTYKVDFRNRQTVRDLKTTKHQRKREMDNLLESAFNTQTNDYFDFYYNTY